MRAFDFVDAVWNSNYFAQPNNFFRRVAGGQSFDFNQMSEHWPRSSVLLNSSFRREIKRACDFRDVVESIALSSGDYEYVYFSDFDAARALTNNDGSAFSLITPGLLKINKKCRLNLPSDAAYCLLGTQAKKEVEINLETEIAANGEFWWAEGPDFLARCETIGICSFFATYDDHGVRTKIFQNT